MGIISQETNFDRLPGGTEIDQIKNIIQKHDMVDVKVIVDAGSEKGDNYVGVISKITVRGKCATSGQDIQLNFILKAPPQADKFRELFNAAELFKREIFSYESVLSEYAKFQLEKKVKDVFKSYPKLYVASTEYKDEYLLMNDIKVGGFSLANRRKPLDINHCKLVLTELGKLHSISFAMKKERPDLFSKLALEHVMIKNENTNGFFDHTRRMIRKAISCLDPEQDTETVQKLVKYVDGVAAMMEETCQKYTYDQYGVIVHGDCWSSNILYKYGDSTKPNIPTEVCFVDWQISCYTSAATDLSYFIYNCMSPESLQNDFHDAIRIYYDSLSRSLAEMGHRADELFPFAVLQDQMKKYFRYGVAMACTLIPLFMGDKDEVPDMHEMNEMNDEEMAKWDIIDKKSAKFDEYSGRVCAVIKHAVKQGFL